MVLAFPSRAVKPRRSRREYRGYKAPCFFPSVRSKIIPVQKTYGRTGPKVKPLRCPPLKQGRLWEEPTEEIGPTSDSVGILAACGGEDVNLVSVAARRSGATVSRFANRAEAATVTARQSRLVRRGELSIKSDSSSQSSADSRACFGPNNPVIAPMNDANSHSAKCIWSAQVELSNDSSECMGFSSFSACVCNPTASAATNASHQTARGKTIGRWYWLLHQGA
jgi:hypothetical protein